MSKLIKWLVLAVVAVALLIKLSLWWSVRNIMEEAANSLQPFAEITYRGVTSSFDGRVGLEGLEVRVPMARDSITIEHAQLKFNGLGELLRFKERLEQGKFPEQMAIDLKGIALEVHGPFMQTLYDAPAERSVFTAMSEVSCGKIKHIGTVELLDMGYRTLETDAEFSYRLEPGAQKLTFNLLADTRDMLETRLSMALINVSDNPGDLRMNPPRVSSMTFEMNDNQYLRKVQAFCAGKLGQSEEEYQQTALAKFDAVLRSQRVGLDQPVLDAYARYLKDPQSLRLEINPTEGMAWDGLQFFEAKDVLQMVNPVLLINQELVQPLGFAWVDPGQIREMGALEKVVAEESQSSRENSSQYDFVPVEHLAQYTGKRLQFLTYDGTYYQGILHKVENSRAYLTVQFGAGSAEMFLRLDKIDKVRVNF